MPLLQAFSSPFAISSFSISRVFKLIVEHRTGTQSLPNRTPNITAAATPKTLESLEVSVQENTPPSSTPLGPISPRSLVPQSTNTGRFGILLR